MHCYECACRNEETHAVAVCRHCMVALCLQHLVESQRSFTRDNPGTGCKHQSPSFALEQLVASPPLRPMRPVAAPRIQRAASS